MNQSTEIRTTINAGTQHEAVIIADSNGIRIEHKVFTGWVGWDWIRDAAEKLARAAQNESKALEKSRKP